MFLIFLVIAVSLAILLAAGTLFIQGYLYSEPVGDIFWRAPAAAAALTLFFWFWCFLNYRAADPNAKELPYETILTSSATVDFTVPVAEIWAERSGARTHYRRYTIPVTPVKYEYRDDNDKRLTSFQNIDAVIVKEGDPKSPTELRFVPQSDQNRYVEEGGSRYMTLEHFGLINTPKPGRSRAMLIINAVHLLVWFLAVWLLLRFQWSHALGLAILFWLAMTMLIMPQILSRVPRKPAEPATASASVRVQDQFVAKMCIMSPSLTM
jgi:hypothetical protein